MLNVDIQKVHSWPCYISDRKQAKRKQSILNRLSNLIFLLTWIRLSSIMLAIWKPIQSFFRLVYDSIQNFFFVPFFVVFRSVYTSSLFWMSSSSCQCHVPAHCSCCCSAINSSSQLFSTNDTKLYSTIFFSLGDLEVNSLLWWEEL